MKYAHFSPNNKIYLLFTSLHLTTLFLCQVECNPYVNQKKMIAFCKERDIQIIGFSPFCGVGKYNGNDHGPDMFEEPVLKELSEKYEKPIGQIILRYMVDELFTNNKHIAFINVHSLFSISTSHRFSAVSYQFLNRVIQND